MTAHYKDTVTAEQVIEAYNHYGLPGAYGIFSKGDSFAFNCWIFLESRKKNPDLTIEHFVRNSEEGPELDEFKALLAEVLDKYEEQKK